MGMLTPLLLPLSFVSPRSLVARSPPTQYLKNHSGIQLCIHANAKTLTFVSQDSNLALTTTSLLLC